MHLMSAVAELREVPMTAKSLRRLPAEWEQQDGVLIAWPHPESDWASCLDAVEPVFAELAHQISREETVVIIGPDPERIRTCVQMAGAAMDRVRICQLRTNDTWTRDFGPITVEDAGVLRLLDFGFNGWGLKFPADHDNCVSRLLHKSGSFGVTPLETVGLILEGGSIESDGAGTLLTTSECLLNMNRNPHLSRVQVASFLASSLGIDRVLWLEHGFVAGDDTDSHIDTLARFCPNNTIIHLTCDNPLDEHYSELRLMRQQLEEFRTRDGRPYRLLELPLPAPKLDREDRRLPATYANFLIINNAVLVPTYRDPRDEFALSQVAAAFPDRRVVGIDCLPLISQNGSLHCITMQIPKGVLTS